LLSKVNRFCKKYSQNHFSHVFGFFPFGPSDYLNLVWVSPGVLSNTG
jgi:hypothetical protein